MNNSFILILELNLNLLHKLKMLKNKLYLIIINIIKYKTSFDLFLINY